MANQDEIKKLQSRLIRLRQQEAETIRRLSGLGAFNVQPDNSPKLNPGSLQGTVIGAVIELVGTLGRAVTSKEIGDYLSKDKSHPISSVLLSAILGQEVHKKSASLVRRARGLYDIKRGNQ